VNPLSQILDELQSMPLDLQLTTVERLLNHTDPDTRVRGLLAARKISHPDIPKFCLALLRDPVWYVRRAACDCSIDYNVFDAAGIISQLVVNDEEADVRALCAIALGNLASKQELPHLLSLVNLVEGEDYEGNSVKDLLSRSIDRIQKR
jgi:HEAT repeat protein